MERARKTVALSGTTPKIALLMLRPVAMGRTATYGLSILPNPNRTNWWARCRAAAGDRSIGRLMIRSSWFSNTCRSTNRTCTCSMWLRQERTDHPRLAGRLWKRQVQFATRRALDYIRSRQRVSTPGSLGHSATEVYSRHHRHPLERGEF